MDSDALIGKSWSAIRQAARAFLRQPHPDAFEQALAMYAHPAWEVRSFALALLGGLAAGDPRALAFLFERCGDDPAWQANEALAMAFDDYCAAVGYEQAIPLMRQWLQAPQAKLRRAVSEGLRPWTAGKRAIFAQNPQLAMRSSCLARSKLAALRTWLAEQPQSQARRTVAKFALEQAVREDPALRELYA